MTKLTAPGGKAGMGGKAGKKGKKKVTQLLRLSTLFCFLCSVREKVVGVRLVGMCLQLPAIVRDALCRGCYSTSLSSVRYNPTKLVSVSSFPFDFVQ